ncbi:MULTISPECIES: histidinol-phosphate transaminase [unclassified Paludibacterium]|uniref:histidinol-phosphate transaminase n=1 Tax=unclassified Paludibacterium TaxID=2618429 RepID=UPI001C05DC8A|nr:histidinol-phosphate transaminase [Paludibacterium sp. B53371]BEV72919.1 histidinol-phosphate transaminase [Paludibacterium sp. THUN1379]
MKRSAEHLIRPEILDMPAYHVADAAGYIKLDAMENPFRLPEALRNELGRRLSDVLINRYPDPSGSGLKAQLAEAFGIPPEAEVLLGNGSDEIITLICQALARPGACLMAFEPSFVMYRLNAQFSRVGYVGIPLNEDFSLDLPRTLDAIRQHQPAVIFISYPNNPTGNRFARADIERILEAATGLVVLDEAYQAFADDSFMALAGKLEHLLVMRTLSKIGLAGIRLGYAASTPAWIEAINKVRPPYNVNVLTQETARFLLAHREVFDGQARDLRRERARMAERLAHFAGLQAFDSQANFITVRVADADELHGFLKQAGLLVKNLHGSHPLLAQCLRITIGAPEENDAVLAALTAYFE